MADRVWKVIEPSDQLSLNKFFDSIIPSMRISIIQNGSQEAPKWSTGYGKGFSPKVFGHPRQFSLNKFFDVSTSSMRTGRDGKKMEWRK